MPSNNPNKRLFIGSLPYKFSEGELLSLFITFGKIVAVKIIKNRWGRSRGMGYVEFDSLDSASEAKNKMHNYFLEDRTIIVDYAQPDPYLTPEGRQRHEDALTRKAKKFKKYSGSKPQSDSGSTAGLPAFRGSSRSKPQSKNPVRQTVYDSRHHGSRIGAKFASKNKKKK